MGRAVVAAEDRTPEKTGTPKRPCGPGICRLQRWTQYLYLTRRCTLELRACHPDLAAIGPKLILAPINHFTSLRRPTLQDRAPSMADRFVTNHHKERVLHRGTGCHTCRQRKVVSLLAFCILLADLGAEMRWSETLVRPVH